MLLGALIAMSAAFGSTMAASLFLAHAGAGSIPVYYMLFALASIPVSILFSAVIDRWSRRKILGGLLVVYLVATALTALAMGEDRSAYYALYIVISVCEQMLYSLYYILFSDYFTVLEGKRHGGTMTVALGLGAMAGSLAVTFLTQFIEPRRVFLFLPLLAGVALAHLAWLTRREQPLDEIESGTEESLSESLKLIPKICRRRPIILLMMVAVFVNILGQCLMEFEAFTLYAQRFPDESALASFLGKMTALVDLAGILIVFLVSNPLIPRIGVARMVAVPPAINLASFLVLAASSSLPAAILAHLNYYPLEHSLNVPVFSLTYNAVPHRFVGRVRVVNDGIVYPIALAASGLLLLLVVPVLPLRALALLGAGVALVYLLAQAGVGKRYLRSLLDMLRNGSVDLDQLGDGFKLPEEYRRDIEALVRSDDPDSVALGLELAIRADMIPDRTALERALPMVPRPVAREVLAACPEAALQPLLSSGAAATRALATESLALRGIKPDPAGLEDSDPRVRAAAAAGVAALTLAPPPRALEILAGIVNEEIALAALDVIGGPYGLHAPAALREFLVHPAASVRSRAVALAPASARDWVEDALNDTATPVRAAATEVLLRTLPEQELALRADRALASPESAIRRAAALALARRGSAGLAILSAALPRAPADVVCELMDGIGAAPPDIADPILGEFLSTSVFPAISRNLAWIRRLPEEASSVRLAIEDSSHQAIRFVLHALEVLGYRRLLGVVRAAIRTGDERSRANALETLSSLAHRHYVLPLLPLFEDQPAGLPDPALLAELRDADDPFIRAAAREEPLMNRLAFLKSVPLFSELSLDQLLALDTAMKRETYLPGEKIVCEGDVGDRMFIIFTGEVVVRKQDRELAQLCPGQLFGEMSLFDEERRSATVAAHTDAELLSLDRDQFRSLAYQRPEIPMQLCKVLAARLRTAIS